MLLANRIFLVFLLLVLVTACTTPKTRVEPALLEEQLPFLEFGRATREDVLFRLGEPFREYEGGRIVTYQMRKTDFDDLQKVESPRISWGGDEYGETRHIYSLVLAFDAADRLSNRSLVLIR